MTSDYRQHARPDPAATPLECWIEDVAGCSVIHVSGEVDLTSVHILKKALNSALAAAHPIIVDFSATRYIDSSAIHALIAAKERHQHPLGVAVLAPTPKKILEIAKIHEVIPFFDTLDAALSTVCTPYPRLAGPES